MYMCMPLFSYDLGIFSVFFLGQRYIDELTTNDRNIDRRSYRTAQYNEEKYLRYEVKISRELLWNWLSSLFTLITFTKALVST